MKVILYCLILILMVGCATVSVPGPNTGVFDKMISEELLPNSFQKNTTTVIIEGKDGPSQYCEQEIVYNADGTMVAPRLCTEEKIALGVVALWTLLILTR